MTRKNEAGQALITTALALGVLMGFAGLAIDIGALRYQKRLQQTAADAAAIAGASNLCPTPGSGSCSAYGGVTTGAQNAAAANGYTDNTGSEDGPCDQTPPVVGCVTVTVNNPPASGPHTSASNYVEVLVSAVQPTYFIKLLGISSQTVVARAVATNLSGGANGGCLYTLGPPSTPGSGIEGTSIIGSGATVNASACGIVDNGDFNSGGNALNITSGTFGVSGTPYPGGTAVCAASSTCPTPSTPAASDPLSSLTSPCSPYPCTGGSALTISSDTAVSPGTYTSISITGSYTVDFGAGTYIIDGSGGLSCPGGTQTPTPTIRGTGVMFYFTNAATFNCTSAASIQLSGPTSGPYAGILMYQDPNDTTGPQLGATNSNLQGALYFPKARLNLFGSHSVGIVVAYGLVLSGVNPIVNLQGNAGIPAAVGILKNATLVE
jgi:Flp pilus assembly protein TadG